jgi:arylsulfatase A-like enzyme/Tfp pilus assembly protein PilF
VAQGRNEAGQKSGRAGGQKGGKSIAVLLPLCLLVLCGACRSQPQRRPSILLITLDTTRADHVGAYGDRRAATPNLDRLAGSGVLFERAVAAAPLTLPAHASLLTGRYPFAHGVRNNGTFTLAGGVPTLATTLQAAGYRTAAFVSAFVLDRRYGLARGFDRYDDRVEIERRGRDTASAADAWLTEGASDARPFFVWVHLYDPHDPYDPPPPYRERFADRPYDGEIAYDDEVIGMLIERLRTLGIDRSTIVAVAGDHGESLGEHGEATHGLFVYESAIRIPMIVSAPGRFAEARRVRALVRGIDLAPTLLDLAGAPALDGAHGISLVPLVEGRAAGPDEAYSETLFPQLYMNWSPLRSLQDNRWKYIEAPAEELYDLANDPGESANAATREPARAAALKRAFATVTGGGVGLMTTAPVDRDTARKLAALGYIGAAVDRPSSEASRPDPKAMVDVFDRLRTANTAIAERRPADAEAAAHDVLKRDPSNAFATLVLARAQLDLGRYREAANAFRRYAELVPDSADAHHWMAICLSRLGEADRALAEVNAALRIDPRYVEALDLRGGLLAARGRVDDALADLRAAVDMAPDNVAFRVGLARVLMTAHRHEEAGQQFRRALERRPDDPDALAASGSLLAAEGQLDAARISFERALAHRPDADDVRFDYAGVLGRLGRAGDARAEYERLARGRDTPEDIRRAARARLR